MVDMSSTSGYMGAQLMFSGIWSQIFDVSSASGYMGEKHFRNLVPDFRHDSQMDLDLNISNLRSHGISSQQEGGWAAKWLCEGQTRARSRKFPNFHQDLVKKVFVEWFLNKKKCHSQKMELFLI